MPPIRPIRSLAAAREAATTGPRAVEVATTPVPPTVLAKLGEAFAGTLSQVLADYRAFAPPEGSDRRRGRLPHRLERLEGLGIQVQQVARVLSGHVGGDRETLDLADTLRRTAESLLASPEGASLTVELAVESTPVLIDPAVLEHLISLGVAYGREIGQELVLRCLPGLSGRRSMMAIEARRDLDTPEFQNSSFAEDEFDDLHWLLLSLLARAAGLNPQRVASPSAVVLTLTFPRDARAESAREDALPRTPIAAGHSVLVIDADADGRRHARDVLEAAGLRVDAVPTVEMARGALRDRRPEVLITGEMIDSSEIDQFVADLRGEQPDLHWIELVAAPNVFALSLPGSAIPSQLSRSEIGQSLLTAVSQQIDLNRG
jgi:hypothetical protein